MRRFNEQRREQNQPTVKSVEDAEKWIGILNRRSIDDLERINSIYQSINELRTPWWRRLINRRKGR